MDPIVVSYGAYLVISLALTVWVGRTLFRGGRRFLVDVLHGDEELADSVNQLLVVGFYLVNFGCVCLALRVTGPVYDARGAIEVVASKVGVVVLALGIIHFLNLGFLHRVRAARLGEPPAPAAAAPPARIAA